MRVIRLYMHNALRNFNYLVACEQTADAAVIDPFDANRCLEIAKQHGLTIRYIINTHEHHDHIKGNREIASQTQAKVLAHANAVNAIGDVDIALQAHDQIKIGSSVVLRVLDTPGHTFSHLCLLAQGHTDTPALFCGDTLFNAGAGNCHSGDPILLYHSFANQLAILPDCTKIYPGHDYMANNLRFTLDREPNNTAALARLAALDEKAAFCDTVTTLAIERKINVFLRLQSQGVIATLREQFPDLPADPSPQTVFIKLRSLRDQW